VKVSDQNTKKRKRGTEGTKGEEADEVLDLVSVSSGGLSGSESEIDLESRASTPAPMDDDDDVVDDSTPSKLHGTPSTNTTGRLANKKDKKIGMTASLPSTPSAASVVAGTSKILSLLFF